MSEAIQKFKTGLRRLTPSTIAGFSVVAFILIVLYYFLILPVVSVLQKAFVVNGNLDFSYMQMMFSNELMTSSIINSVMIGALTLFFSTLVTFPLAVFNSKYDYFGKVLVGGLLLVPMVMPPFVGAIGIQQVFAKFGSLNLFFMDLSWMTEPVDWLDGGHKFWAVVLLEVLHLYPIMYLNLTAALANIDPSTEEMATVVGASRMQQLKDIVWPLARPGYFAGASIVFIWAMTDLGTPLLVGYDDCMPVRIFNFVSDPDENPVGFAMVSFVIFLTVALFLLSKLANKKGKYEMMGRGHVTDQTIKAGFKMTSVIYSFSFLVIFAALIPHLTVLLKSFSDQWFYSVLPQKLSFNNYIQVFNDPMAFNGIKNSFFLSISAVGLDVIFGVMIAFIVARKLIPGSNLLDALVMIPLALPGVVLAFGYIVTYSDHKYLDPVVNPIPLLIIAYAIRRLPYMVRSAAAGLEQTNKSLEEASYTLGAGKIRTMWKITMPLVMANILAGSLLCFAYAMLDVSDSLILAIKEQFYPMTKAIYELFYIPGQGDLTASALGIVAMLILSLCIIFASVILGKKMGELFRS